MTLSLLYLPFLPSFFSMPPLRTPSRHTQALFCPSQTATQKPKWSSPSSPSSPSSAWPCPRKSIPASLKEIAALPDVPFPHPNNIHTAILTTTGNMGDFCCVAQCNDLLCGNIHNTNDAIRCMTGCPIGVGTPEQVVALSRCREGCILNNYSSSSTWTSASSASTASSTYSSTSTYSYSTSTSTSTGAASSTTSSSASGTYMFLLFVASMLFWVQRRYSGDY